MNPSSLAGCSVVSALNAAATSGSSDIVGNAVDVSAYEGVGIWVENFTKTSGTVAGVLRLTECATSGGSYTDVAGATVTLAADASDGTKKIAYEISKLKQFTKAVFLPSGSTPVGVLSVSLVAMPKYGA